MSEAGEQIQPDQTFGRFRTLLALVAFVAIAAIILITLADIFLRVVDWTGLGGVFSLPKGVPGVLDLVEYAQIVSAQFAIACGFAAGTHVCVDILTTHFSKRLSLVALVAGGVISAAFLTLCVYQAFGQLAFHYASTQVSATLAWPLWWYWCPTVAGLALALVANVLKTFRDIQSGLAAS